GIRDDLVTGVQTCALPISLERRPRRGTGPARRGPRLQLVERDAADRRAARAAVDVPGRVHGGARAPPTRPGLRRRGETVRAVRPHPRSAAGGTAGPATGRRRGDAETAGSAAPREQSV